MLARPGVLGRKHETELAEGRTRGSMLHTEGTQRREVTQDKVRGGSLGIPQGQSY